MIVVVTGASGFVGSHVAEALVARKHAVRAVDTREPPTDLCRLAGLDYVPGDLTRPESLAAALAGADAVCHLAGVGDVYAAARDPAAAALLNVVGTANVCDAAVAAGLRRLVYASTWEVYGVPRYQPIDEEHPCEPDHPYNVTKHAGERLALSYDALRGLPVLALRLGTAYGPRMRPNSVFSIFVDRACRGEPIAIQGTGAQSRQFTHVRDIAEGFALAVESEARGQAINLVADETISVRQLAEMVVAALPARIETAPGRPGDIASARVTSERARTILGWRPRVAFSDGLRELIVARVREG